MTGAMTSAAQGKRLMRFWTSFALGLAALAGAAAPARQVAPLTPTVVNQTAAPAPTPVVAPQQAGDHALTAPDLNAWLDGYMPYALHAGDIAGAVVVVVKDGQVLSARGYGWADIARHRPVDPYRTLFRPGSVSKLVTWTAVMQQVEAGKIDLDADVNGYLDFRIPAYDGKPITMRQIMTHTAGFEEQAKYLITNDSAHILSLEAFLKRWTPHRIYAPGTTPAYSNWATTLAGYIVQRVSGMPFDDYVEQRIFAPLGMRYSTFRQPLPTALAPYMAVGYPRASEKAEPFENVTPFPAGSLSSSGVDMARFMIAHLQNGRGILKPETAAMMHDSPLDRVNPVSLVPPLNRMELGFFETNINGREVIGHLGDLSNFHTSFHMFTADGVGLYVSFNSAGKEGSAHTVRNALFFDFADRYFPSTERDGRVDAKTAAAHAQAMTGLWQNSRRSASSFLALVSFLGETAVTTGKDGELVIDSLKGPGGGVRHWVEIAPWLWRATDGHDRLAAQVVNGRVVRWSFDGISPFMMFDRVPAGVASSWLKPLLYLSIAVMLLTFLYWPAGAFIRRRYKAPLAVEGPARRAYRATRVMAGLEVLLVVAWLGMVTWLFGDLSNLSDATDLPVMLIQIATAIITVGTVAIAAWNVRLTWRDGRRWTRKLWSVLVLLAALVGLYFAITFNLMAMTVHY
ncbi:serine hydrolase domain-containing protein [Sphingomonas sp.]|uniref:serine hydrolase domain-containing protein n=1 Tax=Sphingomonas sp. TaxID=28214 RepID=UPI003B00887E